MNESKYNILNEPTTSPENTVKNKNQKLNLPLNGRWHNASIFTRTLGVMFFKPHEVANSLFLQTNPETITALRDRPVVSYMIEGSSACCAGVKLGYVLVKVNGHHVETPEEASYRIRTLPRPISLSFYVPITKVVKAEAKCVVHYDSWEVDNPLREGQWKPKYVVIGGVISRNFLLNMYRSKAEYDIAVIETEAKRPISVKVKQFTLKGCRIVDENKKRNEPLKEIQYDKNTITQHVLHYFVIIPCQGCPIRIGSTDLNQLKLVLDGVRRVRDGKNFNECLTGDSDTTMADSVTVSTLGTSAKPCS